MIGQFLKKSFINTTASTTTTTHISSCCLRRAQQHRLFNTQSSLIMGKTDGNNPLPTAKPYEIARRKKIAFAKKQGRDLFAEQEAQRRIVQYPNKFILLWLPSLLKPTKQVVFHVPMDVTKPELKEILTNYYDLKVEKVNTLISKTKSKQARRGRGQVMHAVKSVYYKKAVAYLEEPIDIGFDENVKKTIESFYDRSKRKQFKEEAMKEKMREAQQKQEEFVDNQEQQPAAEQAPAQLEAK